MAMKLSYILAMNRCATQTNDTHFILLFAIEMNYLKKCATPHTVKVAPEAKKQNIKY